MSRSMAVEIDPSTSAGQWTTADGSMPDRVLLERFLTERDEAAFAALVHRHGPRVMRICRQWLGNGQDAEDACQAIFLVLVHRGGEIRHTGSIGGWLGGVAKRVAGRAKMRATRRRSREAAVDVARLADRQPFDPRDSDLRPVLRGEIDRLPQKYRRPIELCYWEGLSNEQAAERLKCPPGTLKWRLSRAKELLRSRLTRLGLTLSALLFWRLPTMKAADISHRKFKKSGAAGRAAAPATEDVLSASFIQDLVALAGFVRDSPPSFLKAGAMPKYKKARRRGGFLKFVLLLLIIGAIAGVALTIPAIGNPLKLGTAKSRAASTSERRCH